MTESAPRTDLFNRWKWQLCLAASVLAAILHLVNLFSAGTLWRDEAGGVHLATNPAPGEMWRMLSRDSFPALFPCLLRAWSALGLGAGDFGLRVLGCLIGLAILAALWLNARLDKDALPVVSLVLFALNPVVIRWGDSLRAYGCGVLLILLTFAFVWSFVCQPNAPRFVVASLVGVLSVQCLYQNAFLLLAICLGAAWTCFRHQRAGRAGLVILLGVPAALSLLPYWPLLRESQRWWIVEKTGFRPVMVGGTLWDALNSPPFLGPLLWIGLFGVAVVMGFQSFDNRPGRRRVLEDDLPAFGAVTAVGGVLAFFLFVAFSGLPTQPWYWVSLLGLVAACFDLTTARYLAARRRWLPGVLVSVACLSVACALAPITRRMSNVDQVAAKLRELAQASDFVLVYPWYGGVSFNRYYHGPASWNTVPELADHGLHRYDLLKEKLRSPQPLQSTHERIKQTLIGGHTVWIVGGLPSVPLGGAAPVALPPAPDGPAGWYDEPYNASWGAQLAYTVQTMAQQVEFVPLVGSPRIERYEQLVLTRARGYRGAVFTHPP